MPRSTKTIGARVPKPDAKLIEAAADLAGKSVSEWARQQLRRAALNEFGRQAQDRDGEAAQVYREISSDQLPKR